MIGLDTNILLRAMLNDHPTQSPAARDVLDNLTADRPAYVGIPAILEVFWVLRSRYRVPREAVCDALDHLLETDNVHVESAEAVTSAILAYRQNASGFLDTLLAERNMLAGCESTYTFDQGAANAIPSMELLA